MRNGIDNFLYLNAHVELNSCLKAEDIKEVLPSLKDILKQNIERDRFDHENFLSENSIAKFKAINYDNSAMMAKFSK